MRDVIGEFMLDDYLKGDVARISLQAPPPVLELRSHDYRFADAANIGTLGGVTTLIGVIGVTARTHVI